MLAKPNVAMALLAALLPCPVPAQQTGRGVVSGHVLCADTNAPARLARVMLTPLHAAGGAPGATTHLDGSYTISDITPGRYLVTAELPGYLSSFSLMDERTRSHLRTLDKAPAGAVIIDVANGLPVNVDLTLQRGASVSGSIVYDDGSPAIGMMVGLERKNHNGSWEPVVDLSMQAFSFFTAEPIPSVPTDSAGHFRIDGLPPGTYIVHARLPERTITVTMERDPALGIFDHPGEQLDLYSGDAFWRKQAKPITVGTGDDVEVDLQVPISHLQTVSGSVVALSDDRPMTGGNVTLAPQDDPDDARSTTIGSDGRFVFLYVPAGGYVLKTADAVDGDRPPESQRFGEAHMSIHVGEEAASITLPVPARRAAAAHEQ